MTGKGLDQVDGQPPLLGAEDLERLCQFLYERTGMSYGEPKRYFIERRLTERMARTKAPTVATYLALHAGARQRWSS